MKIKIRKADPGDFITLTEVSFASKKYWNYPAEYFDVWKDELTISDNYIEDNIVYTAVADDAAEADDRIIGYYSIVYNPEDQYFGKVFVQQGYWLEHIFIRPEYIGRGIGRKLIIHAKDIGKARNCGSLFIFSDPYSRGFYEKIGAEFLYESPSSIAGRNIPVFEFKVD